MKAPLKVMMIVGEESGDKLGAALIRSVEALAGGRAVEWFGTGGRRMRETGFRPIIKAEDLSIIGIFDVLKATPMFFGVYRKLKAMAKARRPDVVVLVDFPEFNLKFARTLRRLGLKVVFYVSPQAWAWRSYRRRTIAKDVEILLTILPFEKEWYEAHGITNVEFIGNPHAAEVKAERSREEFCADHGLDPGRTLITLLPGSRSSEVRSIFPRMSDAVAILEKNDPNIQFVIAVARDKYRQLVETIRPQSDRVRIVAGETYDALAAADAAIVKCGTATLETGVLGTPMVNVYRAGWFNYAIMRPLISSEYFSLVNLVAKEHLAVELIQTQFTAKRAADELAKLLDPAVNKKKREELRRAMARLGSMDSSRLAAEAVLRVADPAANGAS